MRDGELFTILDWTPPQWRKAIQYHDQLNPEAPFGRTVTQIIGDMNDNNLRRWSDLKKFWVDRRKDDPLDTKIILPGEKGYHI